MRRTDIAGHALLDELELQSFIGASWDEIDSNAGVNLAAYFTEDGVFDLSTARWHGRGEIAAAMASRVARGPRTALHLLSNYRAQMQPDDRVLVTSSLQLFSGDGSPPLSMLSPSAIGRVYDLLVPTSEAAWLIESRIFIPTFIDPDRFATFSRNR